MDNASHRAVLAANPDLIVTESPPVLIDEWQLEPSLWDRVRRAVDAGATGGRFLLTGSATVPAGTRTHSGAGRIVGLIMRPLAWSERGVSAPTVSFRELLARETSSIMGSSEVTLGAYVDEILRSGFPGIRNLQGRARKAQLDGYLSRVVTRDLPESGVTVRRPAALTAWLRAYAAATATDSNYSTILDAATPGEGDKPARQTVAAYREHLERLFILDPIPAWSPSLSAMSRLTLTPKHHLVDPALAAALVGIGAEGLLRGEGAHAAPASGTWLGALFESLVAQSVRVYAAAADASTHHLRTKGGEHEVDLIVERDDRSVLAIEVKLSADVSDHDVRHLNWLKGRIGDQLVDRVVVTTGAYAYRRPDGVAVVPLALLGP
jgi:predicted AAA+ superfamily ATPase